MATALEIAIYVVAAFIVLAVLGCLASLILFPRKTDDGAEGCETEATVERRYREAGE